MKSFFQLWFFLLWLLPLSLSLTDLIELGRVGELGEVSNSFTRQEYLLLSAMILSPLTPSLSKTVCKMVRSSLFLHWVKPLIHLFCPWRVNNSIALFIRLNKMHSPIPSFTVNSAQSLLNEPDFTLWLSSPVRELMNFIYMDSLL